MVIDPASEGPKDDAKEDTRRRTPPVIMGPPTLPAAKPKALAALKPPAFSSVQPSRSKQPATTAKQIAKAPENAFTVMMSQARRGHGEDNLKGKGKAKAPLNKASSSSAGGSKIFPAKAKSSLLAGKDILPKSLKSKMRPKQATKPKPVPVPVPTPELDQDSLTPPNSPPLNAVEPPSPPTIVAPVLAAESSNPVPRTPPPKITPLPSADIPQAAAEDLPTLDASGVDSVGPIPLEDPQDLPTLDAPGGEAAGSLEDPPQELQRIEGLPMLDIPTAEAADNAIPLEEPPKPSKPAPPTATTSKLPRAKRVPTSAIVESVRRVSSRLKGKDLPTDNTGQPHIFWPPCFH